MSDETFMNMMNHLKGRQVGLRFIRWGEPTLHRNIIKFFTIAIRGDRLLPYIHDCARCFDLMSLQGKKKNAGEKTGIRANGV
jgi:hypothetical protein